MAKTESKSHLIRDKLAYMAIIITVYLLGRGIPLYGIDISAYKDTYSNAENLLMQTIGGDANRYSLFALGISPCMISSILIQIGAACRTAEARARLSPKRMNRMQVALTLFFALFQAVLRVRDLRFRVAENMLLLAEIIAAAEMVTGVLLLLWMAGRNKKYGLGGQTILIYINIVDRMMSTLLRFDIKALLVPLGISAAAMVVTLIMEGGEKRIAVQRISIYNVYADKNYLAIKLNPAGVMPVMFSSAFFTLLKLIAVGLHWLFPKNLSIAWWQDNLVLTTIPGIWVYILLIYFLTIGFSMIMIGPGNIAEQFLKGGDSIRNIHAGRDTRRYLMKHIMIIGFFSATVMSICLGCPLFLQLKDGINGELAMLPSSVMMMTSLWCNLNQEFLTLKSFEAYQPFI